MSSTPPTSSALVERSSRWSLVLAPLALAEVQKKPNVCKKLRLVCAFVSEGAMLESVRKRI
jgi:hypothetical protein